MDEKKLSDLVKEYYEKDEVVKEADSVLKQAKEERAEIEELLIAKMIEEEQLEVVVQDVPKKISLKSTLYASYLAEDRDDVFESIKEIGLGSIIKEEINPRRFNSTISEITENGTVDLPDVLKEKVRIFMKPSLSVTNRR